MTPAPVKPAISPDVLNQVDIRVGTILSVLDVPDADSLVQLRVNFGDHERTIVAGLKEERANPREIEGRQALFVVNLEPRKMRGITSEGMLFDIGYADGVHPVLPCPNAQFQTARVRDSSTHLASVSVPTLWNTSTKRRLRD